MMCIKYALAANFVWVCATEEKRIEKQKLNEMEPSRAMHAQHKSGKWCKKKSVYKTVTKLSSLFIHEWC